MDIKKLIFIKLIFLNSITVSIRDNFKIKEYKDCDFLAITSEQMEKDSDEELLVIKPNQE